MSRIKKTQICQEMGFKNNDNSLQWLFMEAKDMDSDLEDSLESSSSIDMTDDASSSSSSTSPTCSSLFDLSDLMADLPIKRGISKFYQGKSESFASLTSVKSVEDLAKKEKHCFRSRSSNKRYVQSQSLRLHPKATIAKNKKVASSSTTTKSSILSLGKLSSLIAS